MAYLLDSNVFIQAKNLHYGFDFCLAFREWMIASNAAGNVFSVEKVHDELTAGGDVLAEWAREREDGFFLAPDSSTLPSLSELSQWASGGNYQPAAVSTLLVAGPFDLNEGGPIVVRAKVEVDPQRGAAAHSHPKRLAARLPTIQHACEEGVFAKAPSSCPKASRVGHVTVHAAAAGAGLQVLGHHVEGGREPSRRRLAGEGSEHVAVVERGEGGGAAVAGGLGVVAAQDQA